MYQIYVNGSGLYHLVVVVRDGSSRLGASHESCRVTHLQLRVDFFEIFRILPRKFIFSNIYNLNIFPFIFYHIPKTIIIFSEI